MTPDEPTPDEIDALAGTEDENGVIQPSVEEILDEDPEHADEDDTLGEDDLEDDIDDEEE